MRLATNYFPPADVLAKTTDAMPALETDEPLPETQASLKMRYEWDRKAAEREINRAIELKSSYPAAHQWYAAYLFSRRLYEARAEIKLSGGIDSSANGEPGSTFDAE